jgi:GH25 family lysozyme M1 (1,4-beta-N-acetylmuramidase)
MSKKILDLSKWQSGKITDWKAIKRNIDGIILRIGYRGYSTSGSLQLDNTFKAFADKCVKHNIPFGVYWFAQEITKEESIESANFIINILKGYKISYPIYYDVESSGAPNNSGRADKLSRNIRTECVIAFCEEIKRHGYMSGVYSSESDFDELMDFDKIKGYSIWCAKYGTDSGNPEIPPKIKYDMWQYTSNGIVSGISSTVDLSLCEMPILNDTVVNITKSIDDIVCEVINGLWGNGKTREELLTAAGYDYPSIQDRINKIYSNKTSSKIVKGDKVKLAKNAVYSNGSSIPSWVKNSILYIRSDIKENGDVLISTLKNGDITGIVNKKYLVKV